ncbi:autolysin [Clostridium puniceum]|uniref:N-acetylmuramoyl-L-alanine amidase n=1 Tax=Clostridium puniceum TaxID=29367 RepID=A0A1S8TW94_9CLOT|nr:CHAP domain-containing protein [Clostridium puniceum]OOM81889.1 autolysin [Clostridium puniceum]
MKKEFIKKIIRAAVLTLIITNINYVPASAKWLKDSKSNWNWVENDVKATGWKEIDEKWYYFDENGMMKIGWIKLNEKWYSLSESGSMETGWKKIDEKWYHFNSDGTMSTGWVSDNGTWYFMNFSGQMETGTIGIDGQVYTFSESGAMISGKEIVQEIKSDSKNLGSAKNNINNESEENMETSIEKDNSDTKSRIGYVATNGDLLNIRSSALISSEIIGTVAKNKEVKIIDDEEDGFYPIIVNDKKGWVSSKWISFEKPKNSEQALDSNVDVTTVEKPSVGNDNKNLTDASLAKGIIRDKEPSLDDKRYYSDDNIFYKVKLSPPFSSGGRLIKGNCTWYAWGRAWEITGSKPTDAGFIGNGYEWWDANKKSGKYKYGSEPRVGAIAVWKSSLPNSGGSGHVAVVEKIENNKVYISESMWHGVTFKYREIYETSYLYGYIYLDKPNY